MMMIYNFYDTCSLLMRATNLFDDVNEKIIISSVTLQELENIKTSINKDAEIKYNARKLLRILDENPNKYEVVIFKESMLEPIQQADLPINDDMRILACAIWQNNHSPAMDDLHFITNDLAFKQIANLFFGDGMISSISEKDIEEYLGYKEI
nr:MAG TPA: PIN domain [Caudoviricetes sp.]